MQRTIVAGYKYVATMTKQSKQSFVLHSAKLLRMMSWKLDDASWRGGGWGAGD
jgi:hypothetical protein